MKSPVLIVIDMLNDYLAHWEPGCRERLVAGINELVGTMRGHSSPILWIRQEFEPDLHDAFPEMKAKGIQITIKGTWGCQIVPELAPAPSDTVLVKKRYSAFFGTELDETLAQFKPDVLILAGINTHACIRTTAIDAYQRDWPVVLALDCIDSYDRAHHEVSLNYMRGKIAAAMTNREIESALES
ncbi:MAG: isochorismatase family cysteine hydrolase, partial [Terracidiphilus sp.]